MDLLIRFCLIINAHILPKQWKVFKVYRVKSVDQQLCLQLVA